MRKTVVFLLLAVSLIAADLPVILMHGIYGFASDYTFMIDYLQKQRPNTKFIFLDTCIGLRSVLNNMAFQLADMRITIEKVKKEHNFTQHHLVCHSQGGLLCRTYLQSTDHTVQNYVSLSGVHMGEFGATGQFEKWLPFLHNVSAHYVWELLYTSVAQEHISLAGYWHDPFHSKQFEKLNQFLPYYNNYNETTSPIFRKNFLKLKKVVFTGSPADEVIEPYQSALLSFWNNTEVFGKYDMIQLKDQEMYLKDTFGIRTMVLDGRASFISVENVWHNDWIEKADLIEKYVLPYLD